MRSLFAFSAIFLALTSASLAQEKPVDTKKDAKALSLKYAKNMQGSWKLMYGPLEGDNKTLRLWQTLPNGQSMFQCQSNGDVAFVSRIAGLYKPVGQIVHTTFRAGVIVMNVPMTVMENGNSRASIMQNNNSDDVIGMLRSLSQISVPSETMVNLKGNGYSLAYHTDNYEVVTTAYAICKGWSDRYKEKNGMEVSRGVHIPGH